MHTVSFSLVFYIVLRPQEIRKQMKTLRKRHRVHIALKRTYTNKYTNICSACEPDNMFIKYEMIELQCFSCNGWNRFKQRWRRAKTVIQTSNDTIGNGDKRKRIWSVRYTQTKHADICFTCALDVVFQIKRNDLAPVLQGFAIGWNRFRQRSRQAKTVIQTATETIGNGDKRKRTDICFTCVLDDIFSGFNTGREAARLYLTQLGLTIYHRAFCVPPRYITLIKRIIRIRVRFRVRFRVRVSIRVLYGLVLVFIVLRLVFLEGLLPFSFNV